MYFKKFLRVLKSIVHKSLKKVKIRKERKSEYQELYTKWTHVRNKEDEVSIRRSKEIESELADKYSENIYKEIKDEIENIKHDEGGLNSGNLWKLKNKLHKKYPEDGPTAMMDKTGNLVTNQNEILELSMKHYKNVLRNRPIKDDLKEHEKERETLGIVRMNEASKNKTPDWDLEDLEEVLKGLKNKKCRDPLGYINEIYNPSVCGHDLKVAILKMMNRIKEQQQYPQCLELCNISSIFKRKGSRNDFNQYRGIFCVVIFRTILERLIYNDEYYNIDDNLSDANVANRKHRNIQDNLFVVNAVLNSVKQGPEEALDLCAYDVDKCFDSLWTYECMNDLYEAG